jgi:hypothetical protein
MHSKSTSPSRPNAEPDAPDPMQVMLTQCAERGAENYARMHPVSPWMRLEKAADYVCVHEATLSQHVKHGTGPRSLKCGAARVFHREWLDEWLLGFDPKIAEARQREADASYRRLEETR